MIYVVRAIFLTLISVVALAYTLLTLNSAENDKNFIVYYVMIGAVIAAFAVFLIDVIVKRKNLSTLSGMLFGILVGVLISLCIGAMIDQIAAIFLLQPIPNVVTVNDTINEPTGLKSPDGPGSHTMIPAASQPLAPLKTSAGSDLNATVAANLQYNSMIMRLLQGLKLLVGLIVTYVTVSFILQTKDDFRFIIPYVEFARATKGPRPMIMDTSVIIDGRIELMAATGVFESPIIVPRFVLVELQTIADSSDRLKRTRGRRGLEVLEKLKAMPKLELRFWDGTLANTPDAEGVDQKLVALAQQEEGRIVTNDFNLNKVAGLRGVSVVNINVIADALKPVFLPGETMKVRIIKPGEGASQGVGYLEDGTMVVVENARDKVGQEVALIVTNALQTAAGKMIFGRTDAGGHAPQGWAGGKKDP